MRPHQGGGAHQIGGYGCPAAGRHILQHGQSGQDADGSDENGGNRCFIQPQQASRLFQGNAQQTLQKKGGRQAPQHDHTDGGDGLHGLHDRRDKGAFQLQKIQDGADCQSKGDKRPKRAHKQAESRDHPGRASPQPKNQEQGAEEQKGQLLQKLRDRKAAEQAARKKTGGHGDQTQDHPLQKITAVFFFDHADPYGKGEGKGTAEYGGHDDTEVAAPLRQVGKLHSQRIPSHIDGKKAACQRGVRSEKPQRGSEEPLQEQRKGGSETDHARHGKGGGAQQTEGLFKALPISFPVSRNAVQTAQNGCGGKK